MFELLGPNSNAALPPHSAERLRLSDASYFLRLRLKGRRSLRSFSTLTVRQSLTALCGGRRRKSIGTIYSYPLDRSSNPLRYSKNLRAQRSVPLLLRASEFPTESVEL